MFSGAVVPFGDDRPERLLGLSLHSDHAEAVGEADQREQVRLARATLRSEIHLSLEEPFHELAFGICLA